jgi:protein involved in polysaccharide export with SLBB domain
VTKLPAISGRECLKILQKAGFAINSLRRLLRNVPVLRFGAAAALLALAVPVFAADAPPFDNVAVPGLPPGVTPEQVEAARQAIRSGAPLPPEVQKALEEHPELKDQLTPDMRQKIEGKPAEKRAAGEPAAKASAPTPSPEAFGMLPAYDWKTSQYVGRLFATRLNDNEVRTLPHFGHDLFAPRPGAASLENMPPAPDYVVGPGDEVVVKMWGRVEGVQRMTVDRDGKIFFPKFGSIYVAGKTFSELKSYLRSKVSTIAEVSSDVTLGQMKGIRVSVIGEVRLPGWYNVSSLHTALQVLTMAGGVKDIGSLRRIEVRRGGKLAETIDLYDFLLKGETGSDARLLSGDTVFVPVVGKLAALTGEVRRPAIYELGREKTVLDLIRMAGGFTPSAFKRRVQVERLESNDARIVLDVDADELEKSGKAFELSDGDIVRVLPILKMDGNAVTLKGNVVRPGKFELKQGMTVGGLFQDVNDFLPETYFDYALLTRLVPPDFHKEVVPVNLREIVLEKKAEADIPLQARDTLTVYNRSAFRDLPKAIISGEVRRPGTFELKKGSRVSDLVKQAGDLTKVSWLPRAEVVRIDEKTRTSRTLYFDLGKAMAGDEKENLVLEDEDQIIIRQIPEWSRKVVVTLSGEVQFPGVYAANKGEQLSSLITRAGGFTRDAYLKAALFSRVSTQKTQQEAIEKLIDDLELEVAQKGQQVSGSMDKEDLEANKELIASRRAIIAQLKKTRAKGRVIINLADSGKVEGTLGDVLLEDGDRLDVPKKMNVVNVVGRVYNPTGIVFDPANDSVRYYLEMVGGPTESADRDHIFLLKADGSVATQATTKRGFFGFAGGGLMNAQVEPGDSILVPEKLLQPRLMKDVKDITQILFQIAVTTGVLIALF